jgi:hypothetical protein
MLAALIAIVVTSIEKYRRSNFERFWYSHHLFIVFFMFWSIHGEFCMIRPDNNSCSGTGVFWQYWTWGGSVYLIERILREYRGRQRTFITKVIEHPSNVVEIQMKKDSIKTKAGQVSLQYDFWYQSITDLVLVYFLLLPRNLLTSISSIHFDQCARRRLRFCSYSLRRRFHQGPC